MSRLRMKNNTMSRLRMKKNESFIIAKNLYFSTRMNFGRKKIVTVVLT